MLLKTRLILLKHFFFSFFFFVAAVNFIATLILVDLLMCFDDVLDNQYIKENKCMGIFHRKIVA